MKKSGNDHNKKIRRLAEEKLLRLNQDFDELAPQDAKQIFYELQVHQIELEMQNEELRKTQFELDDAREKYFSFFNLAPVGYLTISEKGLITDANLTAAGLFGIDRTLLLNQPISRFIMKEDQDIYYLHRKHLFKTEEKQQFDIRFTHKEGAIFWADFVCVAVQTNDGSLSCNAIIKDITERKQAELLLKQKNEELFIAKNRAEESDRLKTAFLQNLGHEIRSPMNAIMGFSKLMIKQYNNKPKLEHFSEIISQSCKDLLHIINDILDISKIESGQLPVHVEECDLNTIFAELTLFFKEYRKRIKKPQINLILQAQCDSPSVIILTDKIKLKQIFINLIMNAFKFTKKGKIKGGCKFDADNRLIFYVSDTGIGIPPDKQNIIFERFTQLSQGSGREFDGTGLGLSIVKGLVSLLGGEIWLESETGKGSIFYFSFPYKTLQPLHHEAPVVKKPEEYRFLNKTERYEGK
ncbi:MAG: PAS domain-containing sensor histidine kinase [Bacteroidales bacterium]|nr:PAS domain-containing sensor histidine kinase [Bacteroidales bacterium]